MSWFKSNQLNMIGIVVGTLVYGLITQDVKKTLMFIPAFAFGWFFITWLGKK